MMIKSLFLFCCFLFVAFYGNSQDTLVTWSDEEMIGRITSIEGKVVTIVFPEEPEKEYKVHTSELQRASYADGKTIYFFEKYPDIVTKMKKSSPKRNMIEISPVGPMFNHFYIGYERYFAKNMTYEIQLGTMLPMLSYSDTKLKGLHLNIALKSVFSEPVRISGLSVRPKMQGAYIGGLFSLNYLSYSQNITYRLDSAGIYFQRTSSERVNAIMPTLHFVFGYNKMIAPSMMLGFCAGLGGGPHFILSNDVEIRDQAQLPDVVMGVQHVMNPPLSMLAMLTFGILFK